MNACSGGGKSVGQVFRPGPMPDEAEVERWVKEATGLFLRGCLRNHMIDQ